MTDNVVNPFSTEMALRRAAQHYGNQQAQANPLPLQRGQRQLNTPVNGRQFGSTDALLGELLREVLEMRQQVAALQDVMADITDAMRTTRIRLDHLSGVSREPEVFPGTALRHGTPR